MALIHVRYSVSPPGCRPRLLALRPSKWGHLLCLEFGPASGNSRVTHGELRPLCKSVKPWKDTPTLDISFMVGPCAWTERFIIVMFSDMVRHIPILVDFPSVLICNCRLTISVRHSHTSFDLRTYLLTANHYGNAEILFVRIKCLLGTSY